MPFKPSMNADQLGVNKKERFVVVDIHRRFNNGDVLELCSDDHSTSPSFRRISDGETDFCRWDKLEYSDLKGFSKDGLRVGDIVVDDIGYRKVLEVFENTFLVSEVADHDAIGRLYSFAEASKKGFRIERKKAVEEVTMEQVCEKFGREVKIKK